MNRLGFIGGSDARRIMEGDWHSLWLEKTSQSPSADLSDNIAVQLGSHTESFNIFWFDKHYINHEHEILTDLSQTVFDDYFHGVPCKGTVDGDIPSMNAILECKHTYDRNNMESCLTQYMPQIQFYLELSQRGSCFLSVIFGNRRWECVNVKHDKEYCSHMFTHIAEFWKCVDTNTEPSTGKQTKTLDTNHILVDDMIRRDASGDNEFISRCHDYIEQEANAKLFESAKSDLKAMVAGNEREVYSDLLTIKRDKRGSLRITIKEN